MQNLFDGIGDSITAGFNGLTPYTALLSLPGGTSWFYNNRGIAGQTLSSIKTNVTSYYPVAAHYNIAVLWAGTNDLANGATPAATFANLQSVCASLKTQGYSKVLVCTMLSRTGQDVNKNAYNALILANPLSYCDGVADFTNTPLGIDNGFTNTQWFQVDGIHPTQAAINTYEAPVIQALLNTFSYPALSLITFKTVQWAANASGQAGFWTSASFNIKPSEPMGKGNISVAFVWYLGAPALFQSIQDTAGNTWNQAGATTAFGAWTGAWFYTLGNKSDASTTISVTTSSLPAIFGIVYVEHLPPDNTVSMTLNASSMFTQSSTSGNINAIKNDLLSLTTFSANFPVTIIPGAGYTARVNGGLAGPTASASEDGIAAASGLTNSTLTYVGGGNPNFSQLLDFNAVVVYSVPDCRVAPAGPNASRTVQGTKIYDVQTSSNAAVPGKDGRAAGAPVDSRVSPNIPQNSRTPGTFGPGE